MGLLEHFHAMVCYTDYLLCFLSVRINILLILITNGSDLQPAVLMRFWGPDWIRFTRGLLLAVVILIKLVFVWVLGWVILSYWWMDYFFGLCILVSVWINFFFWVFGMITFHYTQLPWGASEKMGFCLTP